MEKILDLTRSVYDLSRDYPEFIDIMVNLGFKEIAKKPMLMSVGRMMTLPKGAAMHNVPLERIVKAFQEQGFTVTGVPVPDRTTQLKGYLRRLSTGEDLETIREEFRQQFSDVEAAEIMRAEQEMLSEGTPLEEVQRLCDVHSALFHGATREERIAAAEAEVEASVQREQLARMGGENLSKAAELVGIDGHPLQTFSQENDALKRLLDRADVAPCSAELLSEIRQIVIHYAKKGDLLYPQLKVKYGISGPSDVMWTVDDEIRDNLSSLLRESVQDAAWRERVSTVLGRAREMIYKEENILFPICAAHFTREEWYSVYRDAKAYDLCLGVAPRTWKEAEEASVPAIPSVEGEVVMPGGHLSVEQLTALLNTIPMEISFVDDKNINRYFNEGEKVFKRPGMAIDRDVFSCHPPRIEAMVRGIIEGFRSGEQSEVPVWMEKGGRIMLVRYIAVRDAEGKYLGTMELVQDMEFAKKYFTETE